MKRTILTALSCGASVLALCVTAAACGPGGGYRSNPFPTYPPSYPTHPASYSTTSSLGPFATSIAKAATPAVPQARISVVSTTTPSATTSNAPVGRLQIAPAVSTDSNKTTTPGATNSDLTAKADVSKAADSVTTAAADSPKIAEALKGLVGTWLAVSRQGDGALSTVELKLDYSGWAKLTVPGPDGTPSTTTRRVELENNELKLTGADADVMLGKLVEFNSRQMVLERSGGQVTFVRP